MYVGDSEPLGSKVQAVAATWIKVRNRSSESQGDVLQLSVSQVFLSASFWCWSGAQRRAAMEKGRLVS